MSCTWPFSASSDLWGHSSEAASAGVSQPPGSSRNPPYNSDICRLPPPLLHREVQPWTGMTDSFTPCVSCCGCFPVVRSILCVSAYHTGHQTHGRGQGTVCSDQLSPPRYGHRKPNSHPLPAELFCWPIAAGSPRSAILLGGLFALLFNGASCSLSVTHPISMETLYIYPLA